MTQTSTPIQDNERRAAGVRRTAWIVGGFAVAVYVAFMLAAML